MFRTIATGPEGFQRSLVIKRILPHLSQDAAFVQMFIDEAKLSGFLSHPNLVQIFEFGKVEESFFIAMEYVHGQTSGGPAGQAGRDRPAAPVAACVEIARQICVGLHYAHSLHSHDGTALGIVHRDISPSNLMLAFHGGVKILDFGIARVAEGLRDSPDAGGVGEGEGLVHVPRADPASRRSTAARDIFALGIVLHEMLTGRRLFRAATPATAPAAWCWTCPSRAVVAEPRGPGGARSRRDAGPRAQPRRALRRRRARWARRFERVLFEMRASSHEHTKLLHELFANEVSQGSDVGLVVPLAATGSAGTVPSNERITSPLSRVPEPQEPSYAVEMGSYGSANRLRIRTWRTARWPMALGRGGGAGAGRGGRAGDRFAPGHRAGAGRRGARRWRRPPAHRRGGGACRARAQSDGPLLPGLKAAGRRGDARRFRPDAGPHALDHRSAQGRARSSRCASRSRDTRPNPQDHPRFRPGGERRSAGRGGRRREPTTWPVPRTPRRRCGRARAKETSVGPVEPAGADCLLSVGAFPWAELWVDGKDTGQHTPVVHFLPPAGRTGWRSSGPTSGIDYRVDVTLTAGHELKTTLPARDLGLRRLDAGPAFQRKAAQNWKATPRFRSTLTVKLGAPASPSRATTSATVSESR